MKSNNNIALISGIFAALAVAVTPCGAQNASIASVLKEIEQGSAFISAARADMEAEKLGAKAEARLENPEVGFNLLAGQEGIGNRHDFSISQSFDFATVSGQKNRQSKRVSALSDSEFSIKRQDILLRAKLLCIDLIYLDDLLAELRAHKIDAEELVKSLDRKQELGGATILETNKGKLHLSAVNGEIAKAEVERDVILSNLASLNGGVLPDIEGLTYDTTDILPEDFEKWYEDNCRNNPSLNYAAAAANVMDGRHRLERSATVPEISIGYMQEIAREDKFRGVTIGVAVPLWRNSARIRSSKNAAEAAKENLKATQNSVHASLLSSYNSAKGYRNLAESLRKSVRETDNRSFLSQAQSKGEISILDYLVEVDMYYDALTEALSAEKEYRKALAELLAVEL